MAINQKINKFYSKFNHLSKIHLFALLALVFLYNNSYALSLTYQFKYMFVDIAEVKISQSTINSPNQKTVSSEINVKTSGVLKLFRDYQSKILVTKTKNHTNYYLEGTDRGKEELKEITYDKNGYPKVILFRDDGNQTPINIIETVDKSAVDPLSVLIGAIRKLKKEKTCNNEQNVYDGKRRYLAKIEQIDEVLMKPDKTSTIKSKVIHCKIILYGYSEYENIEKFNNDEKRWPFSGKRRVIDVWFIEGEYYPVKFEVNAPFGKIIGRIS